MRASVRWTAILFSLLISPSNATIFPVASVGDIFTGSMTINPATPCSTCSNSPGFIYQTFFDAGSIAVNVDGASFAGNSLYIEVLYNMTPPIGQWSGYTTTPTGSISIILDGTTPSASIFPLGLSSYTPQSYVSQILFDGVDSTVYPNEDYSYAGTFTSLTQLDASGDFSFTGVITNFEELAEAVPEPSTWVMLLIGFAGIGAMSYRRRKNIMARAA
jgi:PEP-CTERM motif